MDGFMILGIVLWRRAFFLWELKLLYRALALPGILGGCCLVAGVFLIADSVHEAVIIVAVVFIAACSFDIYRCSHCLQRAG